jgi:hypothetical protein
MTVKVKVRRNVGTEHERDELMAIDELVRDSGSDTVFHPEANLTLKNEHQGKALVSTNGCTVTVPSNLRQGFSCGWTQWGSSQIQFAAGAGVTLRPKGGLLKSDGQYSAGGVAMMAEGEIFLYGELGS